MLIKICWMLITALLITASSSASPLYVVDMQKVIEQSLIGKAARAVLESEVKKSSIRLESDKKSLDALKIELEKQSSLLSSDALLEKRKLLQKKERDFARAVEDQKEELSKKNESEISKVIKEIQAVIKEIASKENVDLVLEKDRNLVAYVSSEYDLSDRVIKALNDKKV